jgi:hypothetical protein
MEPSAARAWPENATDRSKRARILLEKVETDPENPGPRGGTCLGPGPSPMRWFVSNDAILSPAAASPVKLAGGESARSAPADARTRVVRIGWLLCAAVAISAFIFDAIVA